MKRLIHLLFVLCCYEEAASQAIGLYALDKQGASGISLHYQNDAFGKTDYYYSQGVQLAVSLPALKKPLSKLLLHFKDQTNLYGLALEHDAYTPTSILSDSILYGDRPYAASFMSQAYSFSVNTDRHERLSTILSLGIIGPAAGGYEIQAGIHRNTGNDIPHGWQYQVQNDVILNYGIEYERSLFHFSRFAYLDAVGGGNIGTYSDKLFAGLDFKTGMLNHPLFFVEQDGLQVSFEDRATVQVIGYDATLQGGIFNHNNPYTIPAASMERMTFKNTLSVSIGFQRITASGNFTWLSREFETGLAHKWGGIAVLYRFL